MTTLPFIHKLRVIHQHLFIVRRVDGIDILDGDVQLELSSEDHRRFESDHNRDNSLLSEGLIYK